MLFLDDANHTMNLDSILQFCISKKADNEIDVKIVMTVRDYAKDFIKKIALNTVKFEEMVLNPLSIQDIQKILKEKFDVKNERYLRQITKIANGNIRLAIIAAISAKSNGFLAINDATDIFRNFYTPIFDENRITENETVVLCSVAIFGPVMLEPNDGMQYILTSNNISKTEYIGICYRLNSIELLDLFEKSIIRISDQSFANYILEYMLIDKKGISIKDLLLNLFPKYSSKLIYAVTSRSLPVVAVLLKVPETTVLITDCPVASPKSSTTATFPQELLFPSSVLESSSISETASAFSSP